LFSTVEHQIADIKQRLTHIEHKAIENEIEYKNFEENLQGFGVNLDTFKQTLETRLIEITMNDVAGINVSFPLKIFEKYKNSIFLNRRFIHCPFFYDDKT
jgi:hypothetical protein